MKRLEYKRLGKTSTLAAAMILILLLAWPSPGLVSKVQAPPSSANTGLVSIVPTTPNADLTVTPPQTVSYNITVTNSQSFTGFAISIAYNQTIIDIKSSGIDTSNDLLNRLGSTSLFEECIGGASVFPGGTCSNDADGPQVVSVDVASTSGKATVAPTNGTLFQLTFKVLATGFSQVHVAEAQLPNGLTGSTSVPVSTSDSYFSNRDCPLGSLSVCTPPVANFTYVPAIVQLNEFITFNASSSRSTNLGGYIKGYSWTWGDGTRLSQGKIVQHIFGQRIAPTVTLTVSDSYGISSSFYQTIVVYFFSIDLIVTSLNVGHGQLTNTPGTKIVIFGEVQNNSTIPEDIPVSVDVEGKPLGSAVFHGLAVSAKGEFNVTWDTTGYSARVYRIDAVIPTPPGEANPSHNTRTTYISLSGLPPTAQLSLFQVSGIAIGILIATGLVVSVLTRLAKRKSTDAL